MFASRVLLAAILHPANMDPAAFPITFLSFHVVFVANLLTISRVGQELQLGARQIGRCIRLRPLVLLAFASSLWAIWSALVVGWCRRCPR